MEVRRGEVYSADLNPVVGTEQAGARPVLVVQIDRANAASPHTLVVPFTTRIREPVLPSHVKMSAGVGGLVEDSVLLCEQVRVIDKRRLVRRMGVVGRDDMQKVTVGLKTIMGLE